MRPDAGTPGGARRRRGGREEAAERRARRVAGAFALLAPALAMPLLAGALLLATGCADRTTGVRLGNRPPAIRITSGPIEDSLQVYRVTFHWTAEDPDGLIAGYEYTTGDTTAVDSLRAVAEQSVALRFTADDFLDTVVEPVGGVPRELHRFGRHHTFHVRAIDDRGARSPFASASFFAVTVAPTTRITNPNPGVTPALGHTFSVHWSGEDLDGTGGAPPRLFTTRLVPVPDDSLSMIGAERLDCPDCAPPWTAFTAGTGMRYDRVAAGAYLFGVRAMDEAGAVEPELRMRGNAMRLRVRDNPGLPRVTITGPGGIFHLPADQDSAKTLDVSSGQTVVLHWEADASQYGAEVVGFSYGIDLDTVAPDDPGWVLTAQRSASMRFDNPAGVEESVHLFYLQTRDSIDQIGVVDLILRVGPPDLDLDILYVDDLSDGATGSPANPSDEERDRLMVEVLLAEAQRRGLRVDQYEVQDRQGRTLPGAPALQIMRHYKLVVWSMGSSNSVFNLAMDPEGGRPLDAYLELGGNLWLMGKRALSRSIWGPVDEFFGFTDFDFGYHYFHIESEYDGGEIVAGEFLRPRGNPVDQRIDGMDGAHPTAAAAAEGWPELLVARAPYTSTTSGIPLVEGMTKGYEHGFRPGRLDTLYTFITNGSRWPAFPLPSRLDDAPCAFRFSGVPEHGKTMVFTFPVFWWSDGALDSLGTRAIEWFFDPGP